MLREMPNGVLLLIRLTLSVSIYATLAWIAWSVLGKAAGMIALAFFSPIVAVAIARPLVECFHEGLGWLWAQPMQEWQGRHYRFNEVQVRVYEDEGALWFAARDVIKASGASAIPDAVLEEHPGECAPIGGTGLVGFTAAGVERFLAEHPGTDAGKFLHWMRREVVGPWLKKTRAD